MPGLAVSVTVLNNEYGYVVLACSYVVYGDLDIEDAIETAIETTMTGADIDIETMSLGW